MSKKLSNSKKASRRDFLKKSVIAGSSAMALGGGSLALGNAIENDSIDSKEAVKKSFSLFRKEYNTIDDAYEISADYERMDHKNIIFGRWGWDPKYNVPEGRAISFLTKFTGEVPNPLKNDKEYSPMAHALEIASWAGHDTGAPFSNAALSNKGPSNTWETFINPKKDPYKFESTEEAKKYVKRAASFLGADEVGIAPYDERWTYSKEFDILNVLIEKMEPNEASHKPVELPFEVKSVIAVAFEMDYDALKCDGLINGATVGLEYSHMTEVTHKIAVFLNQLGYKAIPSGNDTGLSIPIAIQAGLGEYSRMGTLVSEKYGSRVRLAKVYTDLELTPDRPKTFGVQDFCTKCKKCAEHCPSDAISLEDKPSLKPSVASISSNSGVKKWYQDNEKCFSHWEKIGTGCGVCLTVCPYNKIENWVHDLSKMVVSAPVGRDIARQLDDAFGYGDMGPQHVNDFWNKED